jgi:hypothetical protein
MKGVSMKIDPDVPKNCYADFEAAKAICKVLEPFNESMRGLILQYVIDTLPLRQQLVARAKELADALIDEANRDEETADDPT